MTPEQLEQTIIDRDLQGCIQLMAGVPEPQRRAAAPVPLRWAKALWASIVGQKPSQTVPFPANTRPQDHSSAVQAALLGTATLTELKSCGWTIPMDETTFAVLENRRPAWLEEWVAWLLSDFVSPEAWHFVRRMAGEGLCALPRSDGYYRGLIGQTRRSVRTPGGKHRWVPVLETLRKNPDLLREDVWRLFEVEGSSQQNLASADKYSAKECTWTVALTALAADGTLPRDRLLSCSLDALERDFLQFRAGWFSRFHEQLQPTPEERAELMGRYLALLGSRIPPTVAFALKALAVLDKAGRLPAAAVLDSIEPALNAREKSTVTLALRLTDRAARAGAGEAARAARTAVATLAHEAPEVQAAALDLIERHGSAADEELRTELRASLGDLAASQRPRAEEWLRRRDTAGSSESAGTHSVSGSEPDDLEELLARAAALPEGLQKTAGVASALEAVRANTLSLAPLDLRGAGFRRLAEERRLQPVRDVDELIDLFSSVLEHEGPADDIERILEGVARLCDQRPDDLAKRAGPLRKRAAGFLKQVEIPFGWSKPRLDLSAVALAWLTEDAPEAMKENPQLAAFPSWRAHSLACRAAASAAGPLLGAPTHSGGWLDPVTFVARLQVLQQQPAPAGLEALGRGEYGPSDPQRCELLQALLRLPPDNRAEALTAAADLRGEVGAAVRYALGAEREMIGPSGPLWAAAARARAPYADDAAVEARHPGMGPDAALVSQTRLVCETSQSEFSGKIYTYHIAERQVEPPAAKLVALDYPAVQHHGQIDAQSLPAVRWCASIWPANREAWFGAGALLLARNLSWFEAEWRNRVFMEPLLDPDTQLGPMARKLLGLGLNAKEPGESALATDAFIAGVEDGRVTGPEAGVMLGELIGFQFVTPARWAKTLGSAARTSALHAEVVRHGLELALSGAPTLRPADLAALLGLLHELCVETGRRVDDPGTRAFLGGIKGGKSGALAKQLLALENSETGALRAAALLALRGRIERAERWAAA